MSYWYRIREATRAFWELLFPPLPGSQNHRQWTDYHIRRKRYSLLWSFQSQTMYSGFHGEEIRREFGVYKNIRPIYNSCRRIVDFGASHLMGGILDPAAGDGKTVPSCLPILVDETVDADAIRGAIASMWKASNWQIRKSLYTRYGTALGDVGLEVIADEERQLIRLRVVYPGEFERVTKDAYGNVKSYILSRWEIDPDDPTGEKPALYREVVKNENGVVTYETTKGGSLYAWPGTEGAQWQSRWGFVPMVLVQNIDNGGEWGEAEVQAALFKTIERDEQGSILGDQAMKAVNGPWFLTGATLPAAPVRTFNDADPFDRGRRAATNPNIQLHMQQSDNIPILTCNADNATMTSLVTPLQIADVDAHIATISQALEQDYPELQLDNTSVSGDASAKALRETKKKVNRKILERRAGYDHALVRAHQMGMTMGGVLGFPDFTAFNEGSFAAGALEHGIGARAVFDSDPIDDAEEEQVRAAVVQTYAAAGVPLDEAMRRAGWSEEDVERAMESKDVADAKAVQALRDQQALAFADQPLTADGGNSPVPVGAGAGGGSNGFAHN